MRQPRCALRFNHRKVLRWSPPKRASALPPVNAGLSSVLQPLTAVLLGLASKPSARHTTPTPLPHSPNACANCARFAPAPRAAARGSALRLLIAPLVPRVSTPLARSSLSRLALRAQVLACSSASASGAFPTRPPPHGFSPKGLKPRPPHSPRPPRPPGQGGADPLPPTPSPHRGAGELDSLGLTLLAAVDFAHLA